jgi:hypothetical protein
VERRSPLAKSAANPYVSALETSRRVAGPSVTASAPVSAASADYSCGG